MALKISPRNAKAIENHIARLNKSKLIVKPKAAVKAAPAPAPVPVIPAGPRFTSGIPAGFAVNFIQKPTHIPRPIFSAARPVPAERKSALKRGFAIKKAKKTVTFVGDADKIIAEVKIVEPVIYDDEAPQEIFLSEALAWTSTPHRRDRALLAQREDGSSYHVQFNSEFDEPSREGYFGPNAEFRVDGGKCPYCLHVKNTSRFLPDLDFLFDDPDEYAIATELNRQAVDTLVCDECQMF